LSFPYHQWASWISKTSISVWAQHQEWIVPTSQSIHIIGVSIVFASAVLISLRTLGVGPSGRSVPQLVQTLRPWMYGALVALLLTGTLQTIIEPLRQFSATVFWIKMALVICVVAITTTFVRGVRRHPEGWSGRSGSSASAKLFAVVSLAMWIGIIFCGRLIGYTYSIA
jgi:hypothetical protein